jgi:hypothetical protein
MADKKITELTASTTPLAGTEVLPVVQSGVTKKTSVESVLTSVQPSGTANAVAYLNAAKSLTTGTGLYFNGTNLAVGLTNPTSYYAPQFVVNGGADGGITIVNTPTGDARLMFADGTSGAQQYAGQIFYNHSNNYMVFGTNGGNEGLRIDNAGNVSLAIGNLVIGTAGKGIDFSADGQAAGMTSELLDDYEEGTFTPTYTSTGTPPTVTYSHQYGKYTKIGRQVFFTVEIGTNSATAGTGVLAIGGLPFTSVNDRYSGTLSVGYADSFTTASPCGAYIGANSTITQLTHESSVTARTDMLTSFLTDGAGQNYLIISGSYMV